MTDLNKIKEWVEITKKERRENATRNAYRSYLKSTDYRLSDVYVTYSNFKARAFNQIEEEMEDFSGRALKIISYNSQMFTCGYVVKFEDEVYFVRHTRDYRDCIHLRKEREK